MVNRFRMARLEEGKKQIEVAIRAGIPVATLSQFENGWRIPTPPQMKKLKRILPRLRDLADDLREARDGSQN